MFLKIEPSSVLGFVGTMEFRDFFLLAFVPVLVLDNFMYGEATVVRTTNGKFVGKKVTLFGTEVNQFLGVPYAEPPVGDLRFQKTQEIKRSSDQVFLALSQPPACHQFTHNPFPWYINSSAKSEDCLYLNIWTPSDASPENQKAVFYFMYGGSFRYGSIRTELYSGIPLAALGDIIVVTVNYRVGTFGFLMSGTKDAPGNAGMWDILEGLRWVNRYISAFGGDPARITIAGESAGAIAVGLLSVSPLAKGLYAREIMESGAPTYTTADNNTQNTAYSQQLSKLVGCASDTFTIQDNPEAVVKCLKNLKATRISNAESLMNPQNTQLYIPQYGDEILPTNPRLAVKNGQFRCTDLLTGNNQDEGSFKLTTGHPKVFGFHGEKMPFINKTAGKEYIRQVFQNNPIRESVVHHYLPDDESYDSYYFVPRRVYASIGDFGLLCPTVFYAEECAKQGKDVYFYFWRHRPSNSPWAKWMGAAHFTEVEFVFGGPVINPDDYKTSEVQLSRELIDVWSSFVKTGSPGVRWPTFSREEHGYRNIGRETGNRPGFESHLENCDFFRKTIGFE